MEFDKVIINAIIARRSLIIIRLSNFFILYQNLVLIIHLIKFYLLCGLTEIYQIVTGESTEQLFLPFHS